MLAQLVRMLAPFQPPGPGIALTPVIEWLMTHPDNQMGLDYYDFRVALRNDGLKPIRDFMVEVEIPRRYMQDAGGFSAEVASRNPDYRLFRNTMAQMMPPHVIYPDDTKPAISLHYIINRQHYLQGITEAIRVRVYSGDELVSSTEYQIAEMLNAERVEMILAPRLDALRKIYGAARSVQSLFENSKMTISRPISLRNW